MIEGVRDFFRFGWIFKSIPRDFRVKREVSAVELPFYGNYLAVKQLVSRAVDIAERPGSVDTDALGTLSSSMSDLFKNALEVAEEYSEGDLPNTLIFTHGNQRSLLRQVVSLHDNGFVHVDQWAGTTDSIDPDQLNLVHLHLTGDNAQNIHLVSASMEVAFYAPFSKGDTVTSIRGKRDLPLPK